MRLCDRCLSLALILALSSTFSCAKPAHQPHAVSAPVLPRPAPPVVQPAPVGEKTVRGPARLRTPAGAVWLLPAHLLATQRGRRILVRDEERSISVWINELAGSCEAAIDQIWKHAGQVKPQSRPLERPPAQEFDEVCVETYLPRKDGVVAQALARRKGRYVWVALLQGPGPSVDKRMAQVRALLGSLRAPGVVETDLSKQTPRPTLPARAAIEAFIDKAMKATGTPGLALAIIEDGKLAWSSGYGVRELGKPAKVTPQTKMMIGSVTKSLSTLLMARAVDAGKLRWTDKVQAVKPDFTLGEPTLAATLTVEQLVCACTGLPRRDMPLVLEFERKTPDDVWRELGTMKPTTKLRETFQYQNHLVAAGGYIAAAALHPRLPHGRAFDRAMREVVFVPLGMRATTLDHKAASADRQRATPHSQNLEGVHERVSLAHERFASYIRPSGGVWSTALDMARYVMAELARGKNAKGERVVSEANLTRRWQPQVKMSAQASYGLGWMTLRHKGLRVISHGGGTMGFATWVAFLPEKGVGVVMLSNGTGGHTVERLLWARLLETWFGSREQALQGLVFAQATEKRQRDTLRKRLRPPDGAWMKPLLGAHFNADLGRITIQAHQGGYRLDAGVYKTGLIAHARRDGQTGLIFTSPPLAGLELVRRTDGRLELKRLQEHYVFDRLQP